MVFDFFFFAQGHDIFHSIMNTETLYCKVNGSSTPHKSTRNMFLSISKKNEENESVPLKTPREKNFRCVICTFLGNSNEKISFLHHYVERANKVMKISI